MLIAALLVALLGWPLQDTTVVTPTPTGAWWAIGLLGLWQVIGPVVSSALFKKWTAVQAKLHGVGKALVYVVISTLALQLPKWISYAADPNPDNWKPAMFFDLLTSIGATLLYKLGTKPDAPAALSAVKRRRTSAPKANGPATPPSDYSGG